MLEKIKALKGEIEAAAPETALQLEELRIRLISKKGVISQLFEEFREVDPLLKKEVGKAQIGRATA